MPRAIVNVSKELLAEVLTTGSKPPFEIKDGLPAGAEFDGEWYDPITETFRLRFRHDSFPAVPAGHPLPVIDPTVCRVEADAPAVVGG